MDKNALVKIFDQHSSALFHYARRLCNDPVLADQIVGDVFANLLEQLAAGRGPTSDLRAYLYRSTYHRIVDEARYSQRRAPLEAAATLFQDTRAASLRAEDQIMFEQIVHALKHDLTEDQRHVIILRFLEEFSLRETAAITGKTVDNVKVIQIRALAALRKSLARREIKKTMSSSAIGDLSKALRAG